MENTNNLKDTNHPAAPDPVIKSPTTGTKNSSVLNPGKAFLAKSARVLIAPRAARAKKGNETPVFKGFFFGQWGSGKTTVLRGLLEQGFKVLVITTDVGGSGTSAVKIPLRMENKENLLDNLYEIVLDNDEEFQTFLQNPKVFFPDIYTWDPDFLFWDGAAGWQQVYLSEKIGEIPVGRDISAAVESGLVFEQPQWGAMRNGTFRGFHKFCSLHNRETGKIWHKIVTCQEGLKSQKDGANSSSLKETHMPLLQGAGGQLIGGAFDLIIRTKEVKEAGKPSRYLYQIKNENSMSKVRGFKLPNEMEADMFKLWAIIEQQGGFVRNATDETQKVTE